MTTTQEQSDPTEKEIHAHVTKRRQEVNGVIAVAHVEGSRLWTIGGIPFVSLNLGTHWREDVDHAVKCATEDKIRSTRPREYFRTERPAPTDEEIKAAVETVAKITMAVKGKLGHRADPVEVAAALLCFFGWHR